MTTAGSPRLEVMAQEADARRKPTHTPGPWVHQPGGLSVRAETGAIIAGTDTPARSTQECAANARLIGAAPELLEAVKDLFAMVDEDLLVRNTENDAAPDWAMRQIELVRRLATAQATIAKATGNDS